MYDYIKGTVIKTNINSIILENNNIGYIIYTPKPYNFKINEEVKINLYQHIREQENTLYGFKDLKDKDLFLKLIEVRGLGCKTAIPLLTTESSNIISAIEQENINYLKKFPKIGDKLAKQIILDLKGKLVSDKVDKSESKDDLISALKSLGYKTPSINQIIDEIKSSDKIEIQIKEALKLMLK